MFKRMAIVIMLVFMLAVGWTSRAAETQPPITKMLAMIPDLPEARDFLLSYVDYRAVEKARPGAAHPKSWAEWKALNDAGDPSLGLWIAAFMGVASGPAKLMQSLRLGENMPTIMGFDWFAVDQGAEYGQPPSEVRILAGNFDAHKIDAAVSQRGYTQSDLNGLPLWCGPDGCESGMNINAAERVPGEPFGGDLGRKWPLLLRKGYLIGTGNFALLQAHANVQAGTQPALADAPDYGAATQAITQSGLLIQAYFINPTLIQSMTFYVCAPTANQSQCVDQARAQFVPIAPYSLLVMADTATDTEQQALVALVYDTEADAKTAGDVISARLSTYTSIAVRRPYADLLTERDATVEATTYASQNTGKFVTVITFRAPLASNQLKDGRYVSSSMVYRLLVNSLMQRDTGWLAVTFE